MSLTWRVELTSHATRSLKKLDRPVQVAIVTALSGLVDDLSQGTAITGVATNVTKLVGIEPDEWRLRVGDYRVRFRVEVRALPGTDDEAPRDEGVVVVVRLGHRRDVYRD